MIVVCLCVFLELSVVPITQGIRAYSIVDLISFMGHCQYRHFCKSLWIWLVLTLDNLCFVVFRAARAAPSRRGWVRGRVVGQALCPSVAEQTPQPEEREGVQPSHGPPGPILLRVLIVPDLPAGEERGKESRGECSTAGEEETLSTQTL